MSFSGFDAINDYIDNQFEKAMQVAVRRLERLGVEAVKRVRDRTAEESWIDQTGNLRSSIGYVICHNGEIIGSSSFGIIKKGAEGKKMGKEYAEELAKKYANNDYVLIIVAGMDYAVYVEAMENKDVLASTEIWLKDQIPALCNRISKDFSAKMK